MPSTYQDVEKPVLENTKPNYVGNPSHSEIGILNDTEIGQPYQDLIQRNQQDFADIDRPPENFADIDRPPENYPKTGNGSKKVTDKSKSRAVCMVSLQMCTGCACCIWLFYLFLYQNSLFDVLNGERIDPEAP